jgi:hypothetical protein
MPDKVSGAIDKVKDGMIQALIRKEKFLNWSLFDWLCIVFEIKARLKKSILIQDVLFKSADAYEAEAILREMCIPVREGEESEEEDTHKLPPYFGEFLF